MSNLFRKSREQRFAQMAQVSRQLGENMKKQEELQEKLSNTQGRQPRAAINAELKLLKEEALTLNQQNKGLGKALWSSAGISDESWPQNI